MCTNLPLINLPNEGDNLTLETDATNKHWSTILKIKEGEKLCKYYSGSFYKAKCNYPTVEKEILIVIRGNEKLSIFLAPKPFPI